MRGAVVLDRLVEDGFFFVSLEEADVQVIRDMKAAASRFLASAENLDAMVLPIQARILSSPPLRSRFSTPPTTPTSRVARCSISRRRQAAMPKRPKSIRFR
jgi:hypothetical protein